MRRFIYSLLLPALVLTTHLRSEDAAVVSRIKVLSDKVEDVSSLDTWKKAFIKDGMTDEQKALAVFNTVVRFRHQDTPPNEFITGDGGDVHDPIKTFNVYGYNLCCCESSNIMALSRYAGLKARGWGINSHSVPEVGYGDKWHLLDASLICYFRKPDGDIAGVEDIITNIADWHSRNPGFKDDEKLRKFMRGEGWKKGPEILANTTAYDVNGWLPAATHGWYSTMQEYDGRGGGKDNKAFVYEYGYALGYEVNIQLRPGEKLTRNWSNKGLHINGDGKGGTPGALTTKVGAADLRYSPPLGDLANARVGNGTHVYDVPLASKTFRASALSAENLASKGEDGNSPALHAKDTAQPGVLVLRMPSSYVYLTGELRAKAVVGDGGSIAIAFSDNNGMDWKDVSTITSSGDQTIDLKPLVYRRYDYRLRVMLKGKGTGLDALTISHDIQHSQRPLPALDKGDNKISFSVGAQESTITVHASGSLEHKGKQVMFTDFHPITENIQPGTLILSGGSGSVAFPISTPGEMTRLRFGCFYRARDAKDAWEYQVSFDGGKTYKTVDTVTGPTGNGMCKYVVFSDIPSGTKEALVRFAGTQRNTTMISHFRIDADYNVPNGGFRPVKITYQWDEDGKHKEDVHIARTAEDNYTIKCAAKPVMKSIVLELAD